MICRHCHKENREIAKYCKWCGESMQQEETVFSRLVSRDDVKKQLISVAETYAILKTRGMNNIRLDCDTIIVGNTGTGKTLVAHIMADYLAQHRIIDPEKVQYVNAVDYDKFVEHWDDNVAKAKGGMLVFENVHKLLAGRAAGQLNPLDKLFTEMGTWNEDPIVVITGQPQTMDEFFEKSPAARHRFKYMLRLSPYTFDELTDICKLLLRTQYGLEYFTPEAQRRLSRLFKYKVKTADSTFGGAHEASTVADGVFTSFISRGISNDNLEVLEEDITGYVPDERNLDDIMHDLDEFVGMEDIKTAVKEIAWEVQGVVERQQRGLGGTTLPALHFILTGNPGTGKTSVARKLGEILEAVGYLDSGHVVEADRSKMVSKYQGETPQLVDNLCDKAMGGILFIDEAYTLAPTNENRTKDELGTQALEHLMKRMEDDRGKFVVVAAGYKDEMENLFRINPGVKSRFNRFLHIDDYNANELLEILEIFCTKNGYIMSKDARALARQVVQQMYDTRDKNFANARAVRSLYEQMCTRQAERMHDIDISTLSNNDIMTFVASDVPYSAPKTVDFHESLKAFDKLTGLKEVKEHISTLAATINMAVQRGETASVAGHYIFSGNPGTGKTTVARIMAEVLHSLGVVSRGQLVEADRSALVAGFTGQTAIKTNQLVDKALGGVLFIDEAYTLQTSDMDSFGREAIDTLLKRMEDDRGKFVCIMAGYPDEMQKLLDSNPGLRSRFTETITFEDYKPQELFEIFMHLCMARKLVLSSEAQAGAQRCFQRIWATRDKMFGNGREVRKIFDRAIQNQGKRLMKQMTNPMFKQEQMFELTLADIEGERTDQVRPLDDVLADLNEFVGMHEVKETIRRLAVQTMFMRERAKMGLGTEEPTPVNIILTGNPGTGKTTVARKLGEVLQSIGLLPTSRVIETDRSVLIGKYLGETPKLVTDYCRRANGGILFIDEAYMLIQGDDKYGHEAVDTLMKIMEDEAGKFVVIAAGYKEEMTEFLKANAGLASRFNYKLHIVDYTPEELVEIFHRMVAKKKFRMSPAAEVRLVQRIDEMCENRDRSFGNAREMRNLLNSTIQHMSIRVSETPESERSADAFQLIEPEDLERTKH